MSPRSSCYPGQGSAQSPYLIDWHEGDPQNPYNWSKTRKWVFTLQISLGTFSVAFASSIYSGGLSFLDPALHTHRGVGILGVCLFVLGFGLGPLLWAPLSEMYGRRIVFLGTYAVFTLLHLGGALAKNITTVLVCRLLGGIFGAAPLTNAGGAISDVWNARERGVAAALYANAPFMGPVWGPMVGGFISQNPHLGWRAVFWLLFILSCCILVSGAIIQPETYAPTLLRRRARKLQRESDGVCYISRYDVGRDRSLPSLLRKNLSRPFLFLFTEPIVSAISLYIALAYAILYATFQSYPIVFVKERHFSAGEGGLAFLGIGGGIALGTCMVPWTNKMYWREMDKSETGKAPPEARLYVAMIGAVLLPIGLFWFAWTSPPTVHWIVPILAGIPFGAGVAQIMQSLVQYLMDAYTLYCASAIASSVVLRSITATAFPLFTPKLYAALGDQWACSIFAFLALACMPIPYLLMRWGPWLRRRSNYAYSEERTRAQQQQAARCANVEKQP